MNDVRRWATARQFPSYARLLRCANERAGSELGTEISRTVNPDPRQSEGAKTEGQGGRNVFHTIY